MPLCVSVGAPPLCDRDLSGRGVYPGPRGTSGEPGVIHGDAGSGGGAHCWVCEHIQEKPCLIEVKDITLDSGKM